MDPFVYYIHALSLSRVGTTLAIILGAYHTLFVLPVIIYRLWFSPIAKFPGPFLARITFWYEFYYDWVKVGSYYQKIKELHDQYGTPHAFFVSMASCTDCQGPVVRVTPYELHILDPSYFEEVFVTSAVRKTDSYPRFSKGTGFEGLFLKVSLL